MLKYLDSEHFEINDKISSYIKWGRSFAVSGVTNILKILVIGYISKVQGKKILLLTDSEQTALKFNNDLEKLLNINSDIFPYQDASIYDVTPKNPYKYAKQIKLLKEISTANAPDVVAVPLKALFEKFPSTSFIKKNSIKVKIDDSIDVETFAKKLVSLGYKRSTMVVDSGEFSIRGDIIDVFSLDEKPVRIELWGDSVVDIRTFDNKNQRSVEKLKSTEILPLYKFVIDEKNKKKFLSDIQSNIESYSKTSSKSETREYLQDKFKEFQEKLSEEEYFEGIEYYENYLNPDLKGVLDFLKEDYIIVFDEYTQFKNKYEFYDANLQKQYSDNLHSGMNLPLGSYSHIQFDEFKKEIAPELKIYFDNFINDETEYLVEFDTDLIPSFSSKIEDIIEFIYDKQKQGQKVVIATDYHSRVEEILKEFELPFSYNIAEKNNIFITGNVAFSGSVIQQYNLVVLTDKELFNKRSKDVTAKKTGYYKENQEFIESINDIQVDDFVVHLVHGIGVFKGISKQVIDGEEKDYLTIEYAHQDKLFMPAEQINLLCRYRGSGSVKPSLSRMGGNDWNNTKNKVKKAIEDIAQDLINLYARRELAKGYAFEPDTVWQYEMEEAFEYTETPDQMKAINDTKADMEAEKPMDRLICGDVGFGKTEVALRAIFKAVMSSKQVAVVVPTTILAMQHYETLKERFKPFPIKVELMSRFRTKKEQKETLKNLALGECDIVVGTHRLLQNDIIFKNLGLLIIDEEHKFGVKHKEKLKMLKKNIDILSMSATPIPRTLYMSLSGIKDMSIINTAPTNRLPVKTFVGEFKDSIVKNAINYELERDGQVFYLYNRVETIFEFGAQLKELVPNARIAVAHGQMDEKQLEQIMLDFLEGNYDVLLCTTIIESGLDIPNANTIIIHDSDRFGLAQLYQLRGRVGRSERQAYCYCLYKNPAKLTEEAIKRLKSIKEFTTLGSGYQIALRDIEIRGVGNILGTKQHGQMVNVGFDTYCALLEEAINDIQNEKQVTKKPTIIDINATAYLPDEWVGSKEQKMIEYKRLADVESISELDLITAEWKDRFSKMSKPVENLIKLVHLRLLANQVNISLIRETDTDVRVYLPYKRAEWNIIHANLPSNITKYIKFVEAPKTCQDGDSILLINIRLLTFDELFNILANLFYYIFKITCDYQK
ncbi:MAG: transcription-repair coupling factor [Candidatus Gastranaerophilales bacterium]|nr:transcription-repair coupling factor [Candidatus Gastranaerophilales bacterium]